MRFSKRNIRSESIIEVPEEYIRLHQEREFVERKNREMEELFNSITIKIWPKLMRMYGPLEIEFARITFNHVVGKFREYAMLTLASLVNNIHPPPFRLDGLTELEIELFLEAINDDNVQYCLEQYFRI